ncbi:MAG: nodulation protein NfeD [Phycisphaerales bacterium]
MNGPVGVMGVMRGRVRWWARRVAAALSMVVLAQTIVQTVAQGQPGPGTSAPTAVAAARQARNVAIITIDREIDATMERSVRRRIEAAVGGGADAIVFELNTPGGEVGAVIEICKMIKNCPVANTVAWVHSDAYSGGSLVALACREIVVADVVRFGDAAPIQIGRGVGGPGLMNLNETERQKILAPLLTELTDSARRRGYDEKLVQGLVMLGVELWLVENVKTHERLFIDRAEHELLFGEPPTTEPLSVSSGGVRPRASEGEVNAPAVGARGSGGSRAMQPVSPSVSAELARLVSENQDRSSSRPVLTASDAGNWVKVEKVSDGTSIFTFTEGQLKRYGLASQTVRSDEELKGFFGATNMARLDESWSERLVLMLSNRIVQGILVVIFLVALFVELTHPSVLPGAVAAAALLALIIPPFLNNFASWWEIGAILLGIVLIALELFVLPGFGVAGVSGLLLLLFGLVGIFVSGSATLFPGTVAQRGEMLSAVTTLLMSITTAAAIIFIIARHLGSIPILNKLVLHSDTSTGSEDAGLLAAMDPAGEFAIAAGDEGVAITPLRPSGRVQVGERIYDVVSELGFIDAGAKVRIASVEQFRITVERAV